MLISPFGQPLDIGPDQSGYGDEKYDTAHNDVYDLRGGVKAGAAEFHSAVEETGQYDPQGMRGGDQGDRDALKAVALLTGELADLIGDAQDL